MFREGRGFTPTRIRVHCGLLWSVDHWSHFLSCSLLGESVESTAGSDSQNHNEIVVDS
jgi:hypothetical protein